ncbi:helix-turn-helix domain-containing protein [Herbaspirillum sp. GCM10030257]|uniref:helix-turn-helix domain-containing protein n=1 Tax=Herbaspirillum sp. GCM10030257 TaxID=3273393 RepID=UPI003622EFC7
MKSNRASRRGGFLAEDLATWPTVNAETLHLDIALDYRAREHAIRMYSDSVPIEQIVQQTGIDRSSLYRLVKRCLEAHPDGRIFGFRALVPYTRMESSCQSDPVRLREARPRSGSLTALFTRYPKIRNALWDYAILGKRESQRTNERCPPLKSIHTLFLNLCDEMKVTAPMYPFNTDGLGRPAIRKWVSKERHIHYLRNLGANDPEAVKRARISSDDETAVPATRLYGRVECDGHKIDVHATIEIPSPTGEGVIKKKITRS